MQNGKRGRRVEKWPPGLWETIQISDVTLRKLKYVKICLASSNCRRERYVSSDSKKWGFNFVPECKHAPDGDETATGSTKQVLDLFIRQKIHYNSAGGGSGGRCIVRHVLRWMEFFLLIYLCKFAMRLFNWTSVVNKFRQKWYFFWA